VGVGVGRLRGTRGGRGELNAPPCRARERVPDTSAPSALAILSAAYFVSRCRLLRGEKFGMGGFGR
jgi:hypothetical protein